MFRGTIVHGDRWASEFIHEAEEESVTYKFIDKDPGLKIIEIRIWKDKGIAKTEESISWYGLSIIAERMTKSLDCRE